MTALPEHLSPCWLLVDFMGVLLLVISHYRKCSLQAAAMLCTSLVPRCGLS